MAPVDHARPYRLSAEELEAAAPRCSRSGAGAPVFRDPAVRGTSAPVSTEMPFDVWLDDAGYVRKMETRSPHRWRA